MIDSPLIVRKRLVINHFKDREFIFFGAEEELLRTHIKEKRTLSLVSLDSNLRFSTPFLYELCEGCMTSSLFSPTLLRFLIEGQIPDFGLVQVVHIKDQ